MRLNLTHFLLISLLLLLSSCDNEQQQIDTSSIEIDLNFKRFEVELFALAEDTITAKELDGLQDKFPKLYPLYVEAVMGFGTAGSEEAQNILNRFTADVDIKELFQVVLKEYPVESLKGEINQIEEGFKRFKYLFPNKSTPELKTLVTALTYNTVVGDSLLAIGLDMYLGGDFPIYPQANIPKYKFERFSRDYLVSDAVKAWIITEFESEGGRTLLEEMIFQGKILYLVEKCLPSLEQHILFSYFPQELNWCEENEAEIWFHFIDMELLYTVENHLIQKYLGDAPFIAGFPEGSPGRVGQWVGYQIVDAYMENNSEVDIFQLMSNEDANLILQKSRYKPKR